MSRSKKGAKSPGFDYWGKRGQFDKNTTKKSERAERRKEKFDLKKRPPKKKSKDE